MSRLPNMNLSDARFENIEPGGYVCRVMQTEVDMKKNLVRLFIDITEGPSAGYYTRLNQRANFWGLVGNLSMDKDKLWKFAATVDAFRESNVDFKWNDDGENDDNEFVGNYIGVVARRKHYMGNDGKKKTKMLVHMMVPVNDIREGKFEVPEDLWDESLQASQRPATVTDMSQGQPNSWVPQGGAVNDDIPPAEWPEDYQPGFMASSGEEQF